MGVANVARESHGSVSRLAWWWSRATEAQKWEALKASIRGDSEAPPLRSLHFAIIVAETQEARERLGRSEATHGTPSGDAQEVARERPAREHAAAAAGRYPAP